MTSSSFIGARIFAIMIVAWPLSSFGGEVPDNPKPFGLGEDAPGEGQAQVPASNANGFMKIGPPRGAGANQPALEGNKTADSAPSPANRFLRKIDPADDQLAAKVACYAAGKVASETDPMSKAVWEEVSNSGCRPFGSFHLEPGGYTIVRCPSADLKEGEIRGLGPKVLLVGGSSKAEFTVEFNKDLRDLGWPVRPGASPVHPYDSTGTLAVIIEYLDTTPSSGPVRYQFAAMDLANSSGPGTEKDCLLTRGFVRQHDLGSGQVGLISFKDGKSPIARNYILPPGVYEIFANKDHWDLRRKTYKMTFDNRTNPNDFRFTLGNQRRTVLATQAETFSVRYHTRLKFQRGDGYLKDLDLYHGIHKISYDDQGPLDLKLLEDDEAERKIAEVAGLAKSIGGFFFLTNLSSSERIEYWFNDELFSLKAMRSAKHAIKAGPDASARIAFGTPAAGAKTLQYRLFKQGHLVFEDEGGRLALRPEKCQVTIKNACRERFNFVHDGGTKVVPASTGGVPSEMVLTGDRPIVVTFDQSDRRGRCVRVLPGSASQAKTYEVCIDGETNLVDLFETTTNGLDTQRLPSKAEGH